MADNSSSASSSTRGNNRHRSHHDEILNGPGGYEAWRIRTISAIAREGAKITTQYNDLEMQYREVGLNERYMYIVPTMLNRISAAMY